MRKRYSYVGISLILLNLFFLSCDGSKISAGEEAISDEQIRHYIAENQVQVVVDGRPSPTEVYMAFMEMIEEIQKMSPDQIKEMSMEEIREYGEPLRLSAEGNIKLGERALKKLEEPIRKLTENYKTITDEQYKALSRKIVEIKYQYRDEQEVRSFSNEQVQDMFLEINENKNNSLSFPSLCAQMFNIEFDYIILEVGDNFALANFLCPSGSIYLITSGIYTGQSVSNSKVGNRYLGAPIWPGNDDAVLDGLNSTDKAFSNGMRENVFGWLVIQNYTEYAIFSESSNTVDVEFSNMTFKNIGVNQDGQNYGAIQLDNAENITIQDSNFENVASSVRFRFSTGPLQVLDNEAYNTGRNFFQCNQCEGEGIRINGNSLEHTTQFGSEELEDFINIFNSKGTSNDWIQVNNNRARINLDGNGDANGVANSGCMVILGDYGGEYQEAKNNIGVNPGNCGIGGAGGTLIKIENNKMYSQLIDGISNVAFYSEPIPNHIPCHLHSYSNNQANWIYGQDPQSSNYGQQNKSWTNPDNEPEIVTCDITHQEITANSSVLINLNMGPEIWNMW